MVKIKYLHLLIILTLLAGGCSSSKVVSKVLPDNPTSYVFKIRIDSAGSLSEKFYYKYKGLIKF